MLLKRIRIKAIRRLVNQFAKPLLFSPESKPVLQQLRELAWLVNKTRYWPHSYAKLGYYKRGRDVRELPKYIPGIFLHVIQDEVLNDPAMVGSIENKWIANNIMANAGLPVTNMLARYETGLGFFDRSNQHVSLEELNSRIDSAVIAKPNSCGQGEGFHVFAEPRIDEAYVVKLEEAARGRPSQVYVIEERVAQHEELAKFHSHSLNTIRIDTFYCVDGEIKIFAAIWKVGRGGLHVDNMASRGAPGGIAVGIDIDSGRLFEYGLDVRGNRYTKHPDTDIVFENQRVPYWDDIKTIVKRAQRLYPFVRSIGWDIAVGPNGPIIVEGNSDYSMASLQACVGPYTQRPGFQESIRAYLQSSPRHRKYLKTFDRFGD